MFRSNVVTSRVMSAIKQRMKEEETIYQNKVDIMETRHEEEKKDLLENTVSNILKKILA